MVDRQEYFSHIKSTKIRHQSAECCHKNQKKTSGTQIKTIIASH